MRAEAPLEVGAATPLAHALVQHAAAGIGAEPVFLKGPGATALGLRAPTHRSWDVDVLVPRVQVEPLVAALAGAGWRERPRDAAETFWPMHSVALFHPAWPSGIDVHYAFPGCEAPDLHAVLLGRAMRIGLGGNVEATIPCLEDSAVVLAVHALRSVAPGATSPQLRELLRHLPARVPLDALLAAGRRLGALAALRSFVELAYDEAPEVEWGEVSDDWWRRVTATAPGAMRLAQIAEAPLLRRPQLVWRAVFPARATLRHHDLYARTDARGVVVLQLRRWWKGLRALPAALRQLRRLRR